MIRTKGGGEIPYNTISTMTNGFQEGISSAYRELSASVYQIAYKGSKKSDEGKYAREGVFRDT